MSTTPAVSPTVSPLSAGSTTGTDIDAATADALSTAGELYERVAKVIEVIRPAIQADDGDIELHGVDESTGIVTVELLGACVTCPISSGTIKDGVERILMKRVEGVTGVSAVGEVEIETGTRVTL